VVTPQSTFERMMLPLPCRTAGCQEVNALMERSEDAKQEASPTSAHPGRLHGFGNIVGRRAELPMSGDSIMPGKGLSLTWRHAS
jgi:hypothetical protein